MPKGFAVVVALLVTATGCATTAAGRARERVGYASLVGLDTGGVVGFWAYGFECYKQTDCSAAIPVAAGIAVAIGTAVVTGFTATDPPTPIAWALAAGVPVVSLLAAVVGLLAAEPEPSVAAPASGPAPGPVPGPGELLLERAVFSRADSAKTFVRGLGATCTIDEAVLAIKRAKASSAKARLDVCAPSRPSAMPCSVRTLGPGRLTVDFYLVRHLPRSTPTDLPACTPPAEAPSQ